MSLFSHWFGSRLFNRQPRKSHRSARPAYLGRRLGVEPLESRDMLAITVTYAAGVLTFTGSADVHVDTLVTQMAGTTVTYIANGGPATPVNNVTNVVFNESAALAGSFNTISVLDEAGNATMTVNGNQETYNNGLAIPISLVNVQQLQMHDDHGGNDTINVMATTIPTIIGDLHAHDDVFNVSSNAPTNTKTLNTIAAPLTVSSGGSGANTLTISDLGQLTTPKSVTVTSTQITGFAGPTGNVAVTYSQAVGGTLTVQLFGSDTLATTFTVQSTIGAGNTIALVGGDAGGNTFNIGSAGGMPSQGVIVPPNNGKLDMIPAAVIVAGGIGTGNKLEVNDHGTTGAFNYDVTATTVTNDPSSPGARTFGGVTYAGIQTLELDATEQKNEFFVTPSATTAYTINAYGPQSGPPGPLVPPGQGDSLALNSAGVTGKNVTKTAVPPGGNSFNGSYTFTNRMSIFFTSIESFVATPVTTPILVYGAEAALNGQPLVKVYDATTGALISSFLAYAAGYTGGVHVAVGDFDGAGGFEIAVAPGRQHSPTVEVFSPFGDLLYSFQAYGATFNSGISIAAGNIENMTNPANGAEIDDIVTAPLRGVSDIRVWHNQFLTNAATPMTLYREFTAWSPNFIGGSSVAVADLNGDGRGDVIVGSGPGMQSLIEAFNVTQPASAYAPFRIFFPFALPYEGGVNVSAISAGPGVPNPIVIGSQGNSGTSTVMVFNGATGALSKRFIPYTGPDANSPVYTALKVIGGQLVIFTGQGSDGRSRTIFEFNLNPVLSPAVDFLMDTDPAVGGFLLG